MTAGLVADEFNFDLATLAGALLVIIVVVVDRAWPLSLDAAALLRAAIADRVRIVEIVGRRLIVLICEFRHCCILFMSYRDR